MVFGGGDDSDGWLSEGQRQCWVGCSDTILTKVKVFRV